MEIQTITFEFCKRRMREQIEYLQTLDRNLDVYNSALGVLHYWIEKIKDMESAVGRWTSSKYDGTYKGQLGITICDCGYSLNEKGVCSKCGLPKLKN